MRGGPGPEQPWLRGLEQQRNWIGGGSWLPQFGGGSASWLQQIMHPNTDALRGLHHAAVEVELPDYHRLHGRDDNSSPPDFFRGESSKWGAITDLDRFFERVYQYYCDKGFWCIVTQWLVELLTLGFTISFSGFLLLFVNWPGLLNAKCGIDAIDEGNTHNCDLAKEALHKHPLIPFTFLKGIICIYLILFSMYWIFCFVRFFTQLRETLEVRDFCHNSLKVTEHELQTMTWPMLVDKIVQLQHHQRLCIVRQLSAHDIVSRIMRKENYMIGLLNKGVLALTLPQWVPGVGPVVGHDEHGAKKRVILTKTLEWSLNWCILQSMFDRNFLIRRDFTSNGARLRKRFMGLGIFMLVLSPFLLIFMLCYFFLRNAEQFYHEPSTAGSRRWSNLARWTFREFNELEHMFRHRLNASYKHAVEYLKQFPSPIISMIAKFVSFVAGAFAAVLILIALIDESLVEGHIGNRNLIWYTAISATILSLSRSLVMEEYQIFDPEGVMRHISRHTHYMPKHWRGAENTETVRSEFEALFQYKGLLFFEEMASIFFTPFILFFYLPKCVDDVLQFVQDFTVHIEGVGHVCSLSDFDFEHHGNSKYGSPYHTSKDRRSSQGKMEKSFLSFKSNYPNWEPDGKGKQFMSVLDDFRVRNEGSEGPMAPLFSSVRLPQSGNQLRPQTAARSSNSPYTRSMNSSVRDRFGHHIPFTHPHSTNDSCLDSVVGPSQQYGVPLTENNDQLYWLDKFYTASQSPQSPESGLLIDERQRDQRGLLLDQTSREGGDNGENEGALNRDSNAERLSSQLAVNASSRGIIGNQGFAQAAGESRWWARQGPGSTGMPESSFEPPMFGRGHMAESQDEFYESEEDNGDWLTQQNSRGAFSSSHISEDENRTLELPFGDVYEKPRDVPGMVLEIGGPVGLENGAER
ncbi:unnamed protein product [Sphagnum balticum]